MEKTKKCPYCGEEIMADARKCRYCGEWFNDDIEPKQENNRETDSEGQADQSNEASIVVKPVEMPLNEIVPNHSHDSLFKSCFWEQLTKHYCDFKGSVARKTFWICFLYYFLIMSIIGGISVIVPMVGNILYWVVSLGLFIPFLGLYVRRLKDIGKKWPWMFIILTPLLTLFLAPVFRLFDPISGAILFFLIAFAGPIWLLVLMALRGETENHNKWTAKDTIITVAMSLFIMLLYLFFGIGVDKQIETRLEKQVVEDYETHAIYNRMTSDLTAAYDAAIEAEEKTGMLCVEGDYFYMSQDEIDQDCLNVKAKAELLDKNHARVFVTLYSDISLVLVMVRDEKTGIWLVDDIGDEGSGLKEGLLECAREMLEMKFVVIDGTDLRLRYAPSEKSEILKGYNGNNYHPNVGDEFEYLGESGDFYKIDFNGKELWVSKKYSHVKEGR